MFVHLAGRVWAYPERRALTPVFDRSCSLVGSIGRKRSLVGLYASTITFTTVLSIAAGIFFIYNLYHAGGEEQIKKCEANAENAQDPLDPQSTDVNHWVCQTGFATGRTVVVVVYVLFWLIEICACTRPMLAIERSSDVWLYRWLRYCVQLRQPARRGGASRVPRPGEASATGHDCAARICVLGTAERVRRPLVRGRFIPPVTWAGSISKDVWRCV